MKSPTALVAVALAFAPYGVVGRRFPYESGCTPQGGPGSCNFAVEGLAVDNKVEYTSWVQVVVYDYKCDVIGGFDTGEGYFHDDTWYTLSSKLPYTIDWHTYDNGNGNQLYMEYAGYSYGGDFACRVGNQWHVCQHAFPC